ncbi:MAG: hypothetical protein J3Q66DRAFT_125318 [Benniella sp.]|nr:MAG: hypothetical protein J3Q66DRAFT_125318 [Benniella sp.]
MSSTFIFSIAVPALCVKVLFSRHWWVRTSRPPTLLCRQRIKHLIVAIPNSTCLKAIKMVHSLDTFLAIGTKLMSERKPLVRQDDPSEMTNHHGDVHVELKVRCRAVVRDGSGPQFRKESNTTTRNQVAELGGNCADLQFRGKHK